MKIKNLFQLIGFRGQPEHFKYEINDFDIGSNKKLHLAQWQHPRESRKIISIEMIDAYREILEEGDFCIDIGAHTGDSTLPMAVATGVKGCTLALEPNPYVYHVLEKNARQNRHIANIQTMMAAATPQDEFISFEYSDSGFCNGGRHENISALQHGHAFKLEVFGINLSSELKNDYSEWLDRLKFIKVDAEGFDLYVLQSIKDIIQLHKPFIKAEVFKKTDTQYRHKLYSFLTQLDYRIYRITGEPLKHDKQALKQEDMNLWKHFDIFCVPGST
jgi:FkbM family methyltransferase